MLWYYTIFGTLQTKLKSSDYLALNASIRSFVDTKQRKRCEWGTIATQMYTCERARFPLDELIFWWVGVFQKNTEGVEMMDYSLGARIFYVLKNCAHVHNARKLFSSVRKQRQKFWFQMNRIEVEKNQLETQSLSGASLIYTKSKQQQKHRWKVLRRNI